MQSRTKSANCCAISTVYPLPLLQSVSNVLEYVGGLQPLQLDLEPWNLANTNNKIWMETLLEQRSNGVARVVTRMRKMEEEEAERRIHRQRHRGGESPREGRR
ncbi:hypothetical protein ISN45_Aa01g013760 [Arabidopsis thaliana x Arabidopsis arenosa]|uniref:Uncharacterized protein n=1 Tax=Arabidopsis thaliana x Arabidopsis arenosa TaxID=1240361 RepID=A0A8T2BYL5_9BRAS|nr:hypothetical protein ISN45_Aa01g013760 [Arabidopsis thaliana x Arabidopsis arenosa]